MAFVLLVLVFGAFFSCLLSLWDLLLLRQFLFTFKVRILWLGRETSLNLGISLYFLEIVPDTLEVAFRIDTAGGLNELEIAQNPFVVLLQLLSHHLKVCFIFQNPEGLKELLTLIFALIAGDFPGGIAPEHCPQSRGRICHPRLPNIRVSLWDFFYF